MNEENFIARNAANCIWIDLAGQSVKAVQNKPNIIMVGALDNVPSVPVIVDMTSPGQCFVTDAQPSFFRARSEFVKVCCCALGAANRLGMAGRANQHKICAQFLDQVKFVFCAIESLCAQRIGQALKITKGLKNCDFKSHRSDHLPNFARIGVLGDEVLLKNFQPMESGSCDCFELFLEIARDRNGRNRGFHVHSLPMRMPILGLNCNAPFPCLRSWF